MTCRRTSLNSKHIKTLKEVGYSSWRPHWLFLRSTQNRNISLVATAAAGQYKIGKKPTGQTLTLTAWIHGSFQPCYAFYAVGGVVVWNLYCLTYCTFGCWTAIQHYLNATIYPSIVSGQVHSLATDNISLWVIPIVTRCQSIWALLGCWGMAILQHEFTTDIWRSV